MFLNNRQKKLSIKILESLDVLLILHSNLMHWLKIKSCWKSQNPGQSYKCQTGISQVSKLPNQLQYSTIIWGYRQIVWLEKYIIVLTVGVVFSRLLTNTSVLVNTFHCMQYSIVPSLLHHVSSEFSLSYDKNSNLTMHFSTEVLHTTPCCNTIYNTKPRITLLQYRRWCLIVKMWSQIFSAVIDRVNSYRQKKNVCNKYGYN